MEKRTEGSKKKKSVMMIAAILVVFITTYMLILPAVTLEKRAVGEQDGIVLEQDTDTAQAEAGS